MKWEDTSSYSQGEQGDAEPTAWTAQNPRIRITVHGSIFEPGAWFVSCYMLNINKFPLRAKTADEAKAEGINVVRKKIRWYLEGMAQLDSDDA